MKPEPIREQLVPIAINTLWGQDLEITDQDLTLTIDRFGERYVEPACQTIANAVDGDLCDQYLNIFSTVGTPGTVPTSLSTYTAAGVKLANLACPPGMRSVVVNPDMEANVLGFASNIFNPAKTISEQYMTGKMGTAVGFKWSMDQNIGRQTVGTLTGSTPIISGANQSGAAITTSGWAVSTAVLNQGDTVQFAGVNSVNPISYRDTGKLADFLITANVISDGGGLATLPISPDINFDGTSPFQTVVAGPADAAVIRVYSTLAANFANITGQSTAQALAFHRDAFCLAIVKQELPGGMEWSEFAANPKQSLWIRLVRGYSILDNKKYTRFDVLGGVKTIRPELACRICG